MQLLLVAASTTSCREPEIDLHVVTKVGALSVACDDGTTLQVESRVTRRIGRAATVCRVSGRGTELGACPCPHDWPFGCMIHVSENETGSVRVVCNRTEARPWTMRD